MYSHISTETKSVLAVEPIVPVIRSLFDGSLPAKTTCAGDVAIVIPPAGAVPIPVAPLEPVFVQVVAPLL